MRTRLSLSLAAAAGLLLAGCGEEPAPPAPPKPKVAAPTPAAPPPAASEPALPLGEAAGGAADVLRRYYSLIEQRRFAEAHALREEGGADAGAFAAHFGDFQSHRVTIGTPSEPAEAGGWLYVEVPVQTYGMMKNGRPVASAGTITLRRRAADGEWRIFTKG